MLLELLRRAVKEYDRFLINKHSTSLADREPRGKMGDDGSPIPARAPVITGYRPTVVEQAMRALLHLLQFAVAYFVMLYDIRTAISQAPTEC